MHRHLSAALALSTCLLAPAHSAEFTRINATTVRLYGGIHAGDAAALAKLYTPHTTLLVVRTPGGSAEEAMLLGRFIHEHKLDLEIEKTCISSCANYLFPAARHKTIPAGAVLAFHGTMYLTEQAGQEDLRAQLRTSGTKPEDLDAAATSMWAYLQKLSRQEKAFAADIGLPLQFYQDFKPVAEHSETLLAKFDAPDGPLWWPAAARLSQCYGIGDVDDRGRPAELATVGHAYLADRKWLLFGDQVLPACATHAAR